MDAVCERGNLAEDMIWRRQLRGPNDEMGLEAAVNGRADAAATFNLRDDGTARTYRLRLLRSLHETVEQLSLGKTGRV